MTFRLTAGALSVALLALTAAAEDAVEIKLARAKAGDTFRVTKTERTKVTTAVDAGGQKKNEQAEESQDVAYTDEVVTPAADDGKPLKLVRTYTKYDDKTEKKARPAPPLDTPITISKEGGKYTFAAAGGKPLGEFAKKLDEDFNKPAGEPTNKDMLPGKPVKPGDTWTIDPAKFAKSLGTKVPVDAAKATMTGKLVKAYAKDGKRYGVVEVRGQFPVTSLGKDAPPVKAASLGFTLTADVSIDGTDPTEKLSTTLLFEVSFEVKGSAVSIRSDGVMTENRILVPKK